MRIWTNTIILMTRLQPRQLLKDAGYPNGFSFKVISYLQPGVPESPRLMEALAGYWQQIGLDPQITVIDLATYNNKNVAPLKMAGEVSLYRIAPVADMLSRAELFLMPNVTTPLFEDEGSYAIYNDAPKKTFEERWACVDKLNKYYYRKCWPNTRGQSWLLLCLELRKNFTVASS